MSNYFDHFEFTDPVSLSTWQGPRSAGLYAILLFDGDEGYTLRYFGETDNFATEGIARHH